MYIKSIVNKHINMLCTLFSKAYFDVFICLFMNDLVYLSSRDRVYIEISKRMMDVQGIATKKANCWHKYLVM